MRIHKVEDSMVGSPIEDDPLAVPTVTIRFEDGSTENVQMGIPPETDKLFHALVGYGVNVWAHVETSLFECCYILLGTTESMAAIAFYSHSDSSHRKQFVQELMAATDLPPELAKDWNILMKEMERLTPLRNWLAHQPIVIQSIIRNTITKANPHAYEVVHRMVVTLNPKEALRGKRKTQTFSMRDLQENVDELTQLRGWFLIFVKYLREWRPVRPQSAPPESEWTWDP
jgi:hypothetical protein